MMIMSDIIKTTRICNKCGIEKPLSDFRVAKERKGGYTERCKECKRTITPEHKKVLKEKQLLLKTGFKKCTKCGEIKELLCFYNSKSGVGEKLSHCRECDKIQSKIYIKTHKDKRKAIQKKYNHTDKRKKCDIRYRNNHPVRIAENGRKHRLSAQYINKTEERKARTRVVLKARYKNDISYKISVLLRGRVKIAVNSQGTSRFYKYDEYIGCSPEILIQYIKSKFKTGMTWENHGQFGWHIDHKRPCASFDLTDPIQQRQCFHYTNLQPLWWKENILKGAKLIA